VRKLSDYLNDLLSLRQILNDLRSDIKFAAQGGTIYYAADFSEVHAYLHYDFESIAIDLDKRNPQKASYRHRLALAHLFHTLTQKVYMLPPHVIEMWTYARRQRGSSRKAQDLRVKSLEIADKIDAETRRSLRRVGEDNLSTDEKEVLINLVKDDFEELYSRVSDFVVSNERGHALKDLISRNLSYDIQDILSERDINPRLLNEPSATEVSEVFKRYEPDPPDVKRYAKMNDARALLFLRNINKILESVNAKVVFITRDHYLRVAAEALTTEPWFGWPHVRKHFRNMDTIFFDLVLRSTPIAQNKLKLIDEIDVMLKNMHGSVNGIIKQMGMRGDNSSSAELESAGEGIVQQTLHLWDEYINLKLSLACRQTPGLRDPFLNISAGLSELESEAQEGASQDEETFTLLRNFWKFISSDEYAQLAEDNIRNVWAEIDDECLVMVFVEHLGKDAARRLIRVLVETFADRPGTPVKTVVRSRNWFVMPSLQFTSKQLQKDLEALQAGDQENIKNALLMFAYKSKGIVREPELFLFMAYILGMLDLWDDAIDLTERSMDEAPKPSEVNYFMAFAWRKLAGKKTDLKEKISAYVKARDYITAARELKPEDPRYLKEQAAMALIYIDETLRESEEHGLVNKHKAPEHRLSEFTLENARSNLQKAYDLTEDDHRLKIEILNNVAYTEVLSETPDFDHAENALSQIRIEIAACETGNIQIPKEIMGHLADTEAMIHARHAYEEKNLKWLYLLLDELKSVPGRYELTEAQKRTNKMHIDQVAFWLNDLQSAHGNID
jgi:hypothetical protein